ncbi:MAG: ABC transporter ATP-binding protein/permease [Caldilineaceae bacterium]|nr:ABC transporter ATP-binding protein/permease [Caldilineaceae bacterium]
MSDQEHFEEEEFNTQFNGQTIVRIFKQGLLHWPMMLGYLLCIGLLAVLESYFTYLSKLIIDDGILAGDTETLWRIIAQYMALTLAQAALVYGFITSAARLGERVQYDLRKKMFARLQELPLSYYNHTPVGWLMSRLTSDVGRVGELVSWGFLDTVWGILNIVASLAFMLYINWRMGLIVALIIPALVVVASLFQKKILLEYRQVRKMNSKVTGSYNEGITGVRVIKSLRREEENLDEFGNLTGQMYRAAFRAAWLSALFLPTVQLISALGVGSIIWYGGWQFQTGSMTIGGIQAFVSYITFMLFPVQEMARVYAEMQQAIASGERIFSLIDAVPEIQDREGAFDPGTIRGDIVFKDVDFSYEDNKPVLEKFNLHIRQGETIALVGPTGAGKSTLVNLVCRFFEPKGGEILFNGTDYRKLTLHSIHSRIGMVLQTPHLFSGSIRENLRYGRLDASDEEIVAASQMAGSHDFILGLEKGYDSEVGEGGVLLSVGQKQLLSLARAVLSNPEIFVMDEATSSVDTLAEALIQQAMEKLMEGRTSFIIAHRLSTIKQADRILVIENGGVSEMGTHAELIRQRGHYYDLYTKQFRDEHSAELEASMHGELVAA